ncbi:hypothetical protein [Streptomyces sp. NPDC059994]|uniref:hypothetical protein n=1 Tax=Streptomyces sp. NPDC059994 TaxID=3347029 RepID=UPI003675B079
MERARAHEYASSAEHQAAIQEAIDKARQRVAEDTLTRLLDDFATARRELAETDPVRPSLRKPWSERFAEILQAQV